MTIKIKNQIKDTNWQEYDTHGVPFLEFEFFNQLEQSKCVGSAAGWEGLYFEEDEKSLLYSFAKTNSYGEYIFDWDWANFYHQNGLDYYPKLTSMIPFTSATSPHFLGERSVRLMENYEDYYLQNNYSSSHFLFLVKNELEFFQSFDYLIRESFQYHFFNNNYDSFEDFLITLKNKKAKQIRKERSFSQNIKFHNYTGEEIIPEHALRMYEFYRNTMMNKNAISYISKEFFINIFKKLKSNICYIEAIEENEPFAGALYFFGTNHLYGRYWGSTRNISNIHFELCYYQGIDFCIKKGLSVFEAGAQGEHKIARGFRPVKTYSAHKLKIPNTHQAIRSYIQYEKADINQIIPELKKRLPFK
jgi:uncharacterized protein